MYNYILIVGSMSIVGCSLGLGYEEVTEGGLEMRLLFCKVFSAEVVRFLIPKLVSSQYPYVDS